MKNKQFGGTCKWNTLRHNGPLFPEPYNKHNTPILYDGREIILNSEQEEYATLYSKFIDTDYIERRTFKKNFWNDWKKILGKTNDIQSLDKCDFTLLKEYTDKQKEILGNITTEQKIKLKQIKDEQEEKYKWCYIDNIKVKIGNFKIEPPGIFLGRGEHPKLGKIKPRIYPEDVTINLDKNAPVPKSPLKNNKWGEIIHDNSVVWLSSWKDIISGKMKYIFTSVESFFKAKSDEEKFNLARNLKKKISSIRKEYTEELNSTDTKICQLATALYLIDNLALRVGTKKQNKEQADTVGVTSLRVEHITFNDNNKIKLDFLGKDSIRYCKGIEVSDDIYTNLYEYTLNKNKKDKIFHLINSTALNEYLQKIMNGLTSKVWRTMKASTIFQKEIDKIKIENINNMSETERINVLMNMFYQANTAVALLCNHQKAVSKKHKEGMSKLHDQLKKLKTKLRNSKTKKSKNKKQKLDTLKNKIKILKIRLDTREKMKSVSLATSKNNYIDPRIIGAFIKRHNIPVNKIFSESLQTRFEWALKIDENYKF
jgi:DNA topoisomerase-1